jgi:hypothetical protein
MTERIVRPVRAWADYDTWSIYMADMDALTWDAVLIPMGLANWQRWTDGRGVADIAKLAETKLGIPLRSLRVLYENGYELKARSREGTIPGTSESSILWDWGLSAPLTAGSVYALPGPVASGSFPEDSDSEAVERALIAAAAWFSQRQEAEE